MKKFVILLICLCLLLCSCNGANLPSHSMPGNADDGVSASPPYISSFDYDSFSDFKKAINKEKELYAELSDMRASEEITANFKAFVERYQSQGVIVPYWNGKEIELRNEEGFSNISFFPSELYNRPCIFFHPKVSTGENLYIHISYIPEDIIKSQENLTASEVKKALSPNSANIDNLGDKHKNIYEKTIRLADREVTALVIEYKDDKRNSTYLVYDELLIIVRDNPEVWDEEWFSALSFAPCK